jgi:hypothetical protein
MHTATNNFITNAQKLTCALPGIVHSFDVRLMQRVPCANSHSTFCASQIPNCMCIVSPVLTLLCADEGVSRMTTSTKRKQRDRIVRRFVFTH